MNSLVPVSLVDPSGHIGQPALYAVEAKDIHGQPVDRLVLPDAYLKYRWQLVGGSLVCTELVEHSSDDIPRSLEPQTSRGDDMDVTPMNLDPIADNPYYEEYRSCHQTEIDKGLWSVIAHAHDQRKGFVLSDDGFLTPCPQHQADYEVIARRPSRYPIRLEYGISGISDDRYDVHGQDSMGVDPALTTSLPFLGSETMLQKKVALKLRTAGTRAKAEVTASLVKPPSARRGRAVSPTKPTSTVAPTKRTAPPVNRATSPTKRAASPTKRAASPTKRAASPTKRAASPIKRAASPVKRAASPVKRAASPVKRATSPVKRAASPIKSAASPYKPVFIASPKKPVSATRLTGASTPSEKAPLALTPATLAPSTSASSPSRGSPVRLTRSAVRAGLMELAPPPEPIAGPSRLQGRRAHSPMSDSDDAPPRGYTHIDLPLGQLPAYIGAARSTEEHAMSQY